MTLTHRDDTRPPCDSAAEAALLNLALYWPPAVTALRAVRLGELLYGFWEHRAIWRAMQRVYDAGEWPLEPLHNAQWYAALVTDMEQAEPGRGALMLGLIEDHWTDLQGHFYMRQWAIEGQLPGYWLARLKRCTAARQLISDGAEQVEKAWRLDVEGARRIAARSALSPRETIRARLLSV